VECIKIEWQQSAEKRAEYFAEYNKSEAGQTAKRRYYETNRDEVIARANARPPTDKRTYKKKHKQSNPEYYKALTSLRRRRHKNATPPWLTAEQKKAIRQLYVTAQRLTETTGERYVVDHIVPLISDVVCGLHVPWNLRVITQEENLKKSNKLPD
jgi:5-methylcytosine-specific restriction endonuclease McrA